MINRVLKGRGYVSLNDGEFKMIEEAVVDVSGNNL